MSFFIGLIIGIVCGFAWAFYVFKPKYWFDRGYNSCAKKVNDWLEITKKEIEKAGETKDDSTD